MRKAKDNSTQITQVEQINTDKISEYQPDQRHQRSIPVGWSWVKLGDVAKSFKGKKPKNQSTEKDEKFSVPYVDIKAFEKRGIDNYTDGIKCTLCEPEDVLIVWDGARCGLVGRGIKGAIGSTLAKIKSESHLNSFLFYFLKNKYRIINTKPKGVGIPHIEPNLFWNFEIPLPPLPEQKKIVEKIEELFSGLDIGVASLKKAKEQIRLYRQSVLASAFSGKLTRGAYLNGVQGVTKAAEPKVDYINELPDGWKWVKLGQIAKVKGGKRLPKGEIYSETVTPHPYIRVTDFENMTVNINDLRYLKIATQKQIKNYTISKNDLYISIAGTIGRVGLIPNQLDGANLTENAAKITEIENFSLKYLSYFMNSTFVQNQIKSLTISTTQPKLALFRIEKLDLIQPSMNEQIQIVEEIEKRFSEADNLEKAIDESLAESETLRQSILKQAFEGKLV